MTPDNAKPSPKPRPKPPPKRRAPTERSALSAQEKLQAVLAVWTDRCAPTEVCRQMQIPWITFNQWQQRALKGMLQALEPRTVLGQTLSPRLQRLLNKQQHKATLEKLTKRLDQIPNPKLANPPPTPPKLE